MANSTRAQSSRKQKRSRSTADRTASAPRPKRTRYMKADNQYYVEAILDERTDDDGNKEYYVEWEGYPLDEATWEPAENVHAGPIARWERETALRDGFVAEDGNIVSNPDEAPDREILDPSDEDNIIVYRSEGHVRARPLSRGTEQSSVTVATTGYGNVTKAETAGVDDKSIIGADLTRYLVAGSHNSKGRIRLPRWIARDAVEARQARDWDELVEQYQAALHDYNNDKTSAKDFFRQHEIIRAADKKLFIRPKPKNREPTLEAVLIEMGTITGTDGKDLDLDSEVEAVTEVAKAGKMHDSIQDNVEKDDTSEGDSATTVSVRITLQARELDTSSGGMEIDANDDRPERFANAETGIIGSPNDGSYLSVATAAIDNAQGSYNLVSGITGDAAAEGFGLIEEQMNYLETPTRTHAEWTFRQDLPMDPDTMHLAHGNSPEMQMDDGPPTEAEMAAVMSVDLGMGTVYQWMQL